MACNYCETPIYIKTILYASSMLAPTTRIEAMRQELEELTGETYIPVPKRYCPLCGAKMDGKEEGVSNG